MKNNKSALVLGAGGFIGSHMVTRLKSEGYKVIGSDLKQPEYSPTTADEFMQGDLRDSSFVSKIFSKIEDNYLDSVSEIYQFAADMGGAGYIFTGTNDAEIMTSSVQININILQALARLNEKYNKNIKIFYSSSACIYPEHNQLDPNNPDCSEDSAYPANPDSEYGWEKLFSERLYFTFNKNYGTPVRVARYHNIFGPEGTWDGGKEKAPAAMCRKVSELLNDEQIEIWGDGLQTRSFLYIDECIEATRKLMNSEFLGPINIGSEEMVTINELVDITCRVANKKLEKKHKLDAPLGVRGRNSNNNLIREKLEWDYSMTLQIGIEKTYNWIFQQNPNSK
jgi:GDP-D-mannose 3',5'-epimerase